MSSDLGQGTIFFKEKPVKALIAMTDEKSEWYASSIAKEIDCTFPHIIKILALMQKMGLVVFKEKGRKKIVSLTSRGRQIAFGFNDLSKAVKKQ